MSAPTQADWIAERVKHHIALIHKAQGAAKLEQYTPQNQRGILSAAMDFAEEMYRAGAAFAEKEKKERLS